MEVKIVVKGTFGNRHVVKRVGKTNSPIVWVHQQLKKKKFNKREIRKNILAKIPKIFETKIFKNIL